MLFRSDRAGAREPFASRFYDVTHAVQGKLHAVDRNRELAAAALGYRVDDPCDYGLRLQSASASGPASGQESGPYVLFFTMTSRDDKLWPEEHWRALGNALARRGHVCHLPWGTEEERRRCARIASAIPGAVVPYRMSLAEIAGLARDARCVVGVDTGLAHLAAALGVPVVGLYCSTDPARTGLHGGGRLWNLGNAGEPPTVPAVLEVLGTLG